MHVLLLAWLVGCGPEPEAVANNLSSDNPTVREDSAKIGQNIAKVGLCLGIFRGLRYRSVQKVNGLFCKTSLKSRDTSQVQGNCIKWIDRQHLAANIESSVRIALTECRSS